MPISSMPELNKPCLPIESNKVIFLVYDLLLCGISILHFSFVGCKENGESHPVNSSYKFVG